MGSHFAVTKKITASQEAISLYRAVHENYSCAGEAVYL